MPWERCSEASEEGTIRRQKRDKRPRAAGTTPSAAPYIPSLPISDSSLSSTRRIHPEDSSVAVVAKVHKELLKALLEAHAIVLRSGRWLYFFSAPGLGALNEVLAPPSGHSGNAQRRHSLHPQTGGTRFRQTGL